MTQPLCRPLPRLLPGRGGRGRKNFLGVLFIAKVGDVPVLFSDSPRCRVDIASAPVYGRLLDTPVVQQRQMRGLMVLKTVVVPELQFIARRRLPFRAAEAGPHGPDCSADHRDSPVAVRCQVVDVPVGDVDVQKTAENPQLQFTKVVDTPLRGAEAPPHGPCEHSGSPVAPVQGGRCPHSAGRAGRSSLTGAGCEDHSRDPTVAAHVDKVVHMPVVCNDRSLTSLS